MEMEVTGAAREAVTTTIGRVLGRAADTAAGQAFIETLINDSLLNKNGGVPQEIASKSGKKMQRDELAMRVIMFTYEFRRHPQNPTIYFWKRRGGDVFMSFDKDDVMIRDIVTKAYRTLYKVSPSSEVNATVANVMNNINRMAQLDSGIIKVSDGLYWFSHDGSLKEQLPMDAECYYALFNSPSTPDMPAIILDKDDSKNILESYRNTWEDKLEPIDSTDTPFAAAYKDLPRDFDFIKVWADETTPGHVDRYWDMFLGIVPNFLYKKPPAAYFLLGNARGGKSSYVNMLHFIFGRRNTSAVRLNELSDPHLNLRLTSTILNAPDEEMESKLSPNDVANFKSIAAHEKIELPVLYRTNPQVIIPDFMMYLPSNALPEFHGSSAEACMRRAKVIMFTADLSRLDHKPKNFIKETFTKEMICKLLGEVFAFAKYFSTHDFWYSRTMQVSNEYVSEINNSAQVYFAMWKKFFCGYDKWNSLWEDYRNWCHARGCTIEGQKVLRMRFNSYTSLGRQSAKSPDGDWRKAYIIPEPNKPVMWDDYEISKFYGTIERLHSGTKDKDGRYTNSGGYSAVDILEKELENKEMDSLVGTVSKTQMKFFKDNEKKVEQLNKEAN